jgi:hypothetical protein
VKKKWQDLKSKGSMKEMKNRHGTGNRPLIKLSPWEEEVVVFLRDRKSNIIDGIPGGYEAGAMQTHNVPGRLPSSTASPLPATGDVRVLLERVETQLGAQSVSPVTDPQDDDIETNTTTSVYLDAEEPTELSGAVHFQAPLSTAPPSRPTATVSRPGPAVASSSRVIIGSDTDLFTPGSVASRKRELDQAHLEYFRAQTDQLRANTNKLRLDQEYVELSHKKLKLEMENMGLDRRIKLLKERKLSLQVFKAEVDLSGAGFKFEPSIPSLSVTKNAPVPPANFTYKANEVSNEEEDSGETTDQSFSPPPVVQQRDVDETSENVQISKKHAQPTAAEPSCSNIDDPMFSEVEKLFVDFLSSKLDYIKSLVDQKIVNYHAFDLFAFYDYVGMLTSGKEEMFHSILKRHGVNYEQHITTARVFLRSKFDDDLMYAHKENQLQALAEFMINVYINQLGQLVRGQL